MDRRRELGQFLAAKRARAVTDGREIPVAGGRRRVPGLRREEVAWLAGISTTYYTKLEHGRVGGISDAVLDGLAEALQLSAEEKEYVASLISVTGRSQPDRDDAPDDRVDEPLMRLLDAAAALPIHVQNERTDIVAANALGRALYPYHFEDRQGPPNAVRFLFLDPRARAFFVDWERWALQGVAFLRASTARNPHDARLSALVDGLVARSAEFGRLWTTHDVQFHLVGTRRIDHPRVGRLDLDFQGLTVAGRQWLRLVAYSAPAGTPTAERLARLAEPPPDGGAPTT